MTLTASPLAALVGVIGEEVIIIVITLKTVLALRVVRHRSAALVASAARHELALVQARVSRIVPFKRFIIIVRAL